MNTWCDSTVSELRSFEYSEIHEPVADTCDTSEAPAPDQSESIDLLQSKLEEVHRNALERLRMEKDEQISAIRAEITSAVAAFQAEREEYFRKVEAEVVGLALSVAKKLIHREVQIDRNLLCGLVRHELEKLSSSTHVRLLVSRAEAEQWHAFAKSMERIRIDVVVDSNVPVRECRIETDLGSTTVGFDEPLKEIERGFFDLLSHRPTAARHASVQ